MLIPPPARIGWSRMPPMHNLLPPRPRAAPGAAVFRPPRRCRVRWRRFDYGAVTLRRPTACRRIEKIGTIRLWAGVLSPETGLHSVIQVDVSLGGIREAPLNLPASACGHCRERHTTSPASRATSPNIGAIDKAGNHLETLRGDREGRSSIRIIDQWRICFVWRDGETWDVEIVDYH